MSEHADKYNNAHRKERVEHILRTDPKARIDASGYTPPGPLNADEQTGPCKPKRSAFAKGGAVEGEKAPKHAGRKSRDAGGNAVNQLRPQVPIGGIYGAGFTPTHSGMLAQGAGFKKGGEAKCKKATGGEIEGTRPTGGRMPRKDGGRAKGKTNINIIIGAPKDDQPPMVPPPPSAMPPGAPPPPPGLPPAAMGAMRPPMGGGAPGPAMPPQMPPPMPRASGGRAYPIDSGSRGGKARMEKAEAYGPK